MLILLLLAQQNYILVEHLRNWAFSEAISKQSNSCLLVQHIQKISGNDTVSTRMLEMRVQIKARILLFHVYQHTSVLICVLIYLDRFDFERGLTDGG